jgi:hypothetical protein
MTTYKYFLKYTNDEGKVRVKKSRNLNNLRAYASKNGIIPRVISLTNTNYTKLTL